MFICFYVGTKRSPAYKRPCLNGLWLKESGQSSVQVCSVRLHSSQHEQGIIYFYGGEEHTVSLEIFKGLQPYLMRFSVTSANSPNPTVIYTARPKKKLHPLIFRWTAFCFDYGFAVAFF